MNTLIKKTQWMCIGLLVAMTGGAPAVADDTEIIVINPTKSNPPQPNVLFIIDSSGSMNDQVQTRVAYDPATTYPQDASCDPNRLYWTLVDAVPSCAAGNTQFIEKSAFVCNAATPRLRESAATRITPFITAATAPVRPPGKPCRRATI